MLNEVRQSIYNAIVDDAKALLERKGFFYNKTNNSIDSYIFSQKTKTPIAASVSIGGTDQKGQPIRQYSDKQWHFEDSALDKTVKPEERSQIRPQIKHITSKYLGGQNFRILKRILTNNATALDWVDNDIDKIARVLSQQPFNINIKNTPGWKKLVLNHEGVVDTNQNDQGTYSWNSSESYDSIKRDDEVSPGTDPKTTIPGTNDGLSPKREVYRDPEVIEFQKYYNQKYPNATIGVDGIIGKDTRTALAKMGFADINAWKTERGYISQGNQLIQNLNTTIQKANTIIPQMEKYKQQGTVQPTQQPAAQPAQQPVTENKLYLKESDDLVAVIQQMYNACTSAEAVAEKLGDTAAWSESYKAGRDAYTNNQKIAADIKTTNAETEKLATQNQTAFGNGNINTIMQAIYSNPEVNKMYIKNFKDRGVTNRNSVATVTNLLNQGREPSQQFKVDDVETAINWANKTGNDAVNQMRIAKEQREMTKILSLMERMSQKYLGLLCEDENDAAAAQQAGGNANVSLETIAQTVGADANNQIDVFNKLYQKLNGLNSQITASISNFDNAGFTDYRAAEGYDKSYEDSKHWSDEQAAATANKNRELQNQQNATSRQQAMQQYTEIQARINKLGNRAAKQALNALVSPNMSEDTPEWNNNLQILRNTLRDLSIQDIRSIISSYRKYGNIQYQAAPTTTTVPASDTGIAAPLDANKTAQVAEGVTRNISDIQSLMERVNNPERRGMLF